MSKLCSRKGSCIAVVLLTMVVGGLGLASREAVAQTYTVLHAFTRAQDGAAPWGGLTIDAGGNLYGTATAGGSGGSCMGGCGTVFKLSQRNSNWTFSPLYNFTQADGAYPEGKLIFGRDGRLYGTTGQGGVACSSPGCGVIFALRPPATFCQSVICFWSEQVLYQFAGGNDGSRPTGDPVFDSAGNFIGTTYNGGASGVGTVYELTPAGGGWTESVIHTFSVNDGANPYGGLTQDSSGVLYGTTKVGGVFQHAGVVYQLRNSSSGWLETVIHNFNGTDGFEPLGAVAVDASGNVFGTTNHGGQGGGGGGKAFEVSPSGSGWDFALLYQFSGISGPAGDLIMDNSGALYGTTLTDGAFGFGSVFKLTYSGADWTMTTLHDFTGADGASPHGSMVFDSNGNLYGTAAAGGPHNLGVVWEIAP